MQKFAWNTPAETSIVPLDGSQILFWLGKHVALRMAPVLNPGGFSSEAWHRFSLSQELHWNELEFGWESFKIIQKSACFSHMRSMGSRCLGVEGVFTRHAFTTASIRNCSCEVLMALPMVSSAKGVTFGGQSRVAWFRLAGVALVTVRRVS